MVDFDDETGEGEYLVACRKHMATTEQDLLPLKKLAASLETVRPTDAV